MKKGGEIGVNGLAVGAGGVVEFFWGRGDFRGWGLAKDICGSEGLFTGIARSYTAVCAFVGVGYAREDVRG